MPTDRFRVALATGLAVVLAAGCAAPLIAPTVVRDPKFNYPPTQASAVAIYANPPAAKYEVIGEVRTRVAATVPMDQVEASLKEEAAKIVANGVVMVVKDVVTEQKVQRPAAGAQQQPVVTSGTGGVRRSRPSPAGPRRSRSASTRKRSPGW